MEEAFFKSYEKMKRQLKREIIETIVETMREEEGIPKGLLAITEEDADFMSAETLQGFQHLPDNNKDKIYATNLRKKYKKED